MYAPVGSELAFGQPDPTIWRVVSFYVCAIGVTVFTLRLAATAMRSTSTGFAPEWGER